MLNESAVKALGWKVENAVGKNISRGKSGTVKAVVKDFHFHSLHDPITPLVIFLEPRQTNSIFIKIIPGDVTGALSGIKKIWKERVSHRPFEYHFLDEDYEALYKTEQKTARIFTTFSVLAIVLACLGLLALTAFATARRTKEIGIRKVLGASVAGITAMLTKDFLKLVIISILIASPLAYLAMSKWLQDYAYRIQISCWIFLIAGIVAVLIAVITISFQSIQAAMANPVKSLRTE